jgi:two-component system, OmpR family, sensor histidine kinase VicK
MAIIPVNTSGERTDILYGIENIIKFTIQSLSLVQHSFDVCTDSNGPSVILSIEKIKNAYYGLRKKGVKIRCIAEITNYNLLFCKQAMEFAELRHLDGVKGGFGISDGTTYAATSVLLGEKPITQLIYSNVKALVEQQQYMFDALWNKAIPAKQRIKEIEEGVKREFIDTIRDPFEIQELVFNNLKSARDEILIIFSSSDAFHRLNHEGFLGILHNISSNYEVKIRILVDMDTQIEKLAQELQIAKQKLQIDIRHIYKSLRIQITTIIIDTDFSLTIEMKDNAKGSLFKDAVGLTSYSNSESTISSYTSIFENLWIQSELEEQKNVK